jgi:hypothetical protein
MIRVIDDLPQGIVGFEASDEVSADDYRQALDPLVERATAGGGKVHLLAVLGPGLRGVSTGAMLEDARLGLRNWSAWERIAIVTDEHRLKEAIHLLGWLLPGEVAVFSPDQRAGAIGWLSAE